MGKKGLFLYFFLRKLLFIQFLPLYLRVVTKKIKF